MMLVKSLKRASGDLDKTGTKYKKKMDDMAGSWQGSSGKSFAEAAGRVEAGYIINRSVLEQMIHDVTAAVKSMTEQDTMTGRTVSTMTIE